MSAPTPPSARDARGARVSRDRPERGEALAAFEPFAELDGRTPVLVGVGEAGERLDDPSYRALSPAGLAGLAAQLALADAAAAAADDPPAESATGAPVAGFPGPADVAARLAAEIDVVAAVRQFEDCGLEPRTPLGRSSNLPRSIAARVGADPARAVLEVGGGQSPQHLVTEFAGEIAAGAARAVLLAGAEALSSARHWRNAPAARRPDWSEDPGGELDDRGPGLADMVSPQAVRYGIAHAPAAYALFENARRARRGEDRRTYALGMGELFAPMSAVAARNPLSAAPVARSAAELVAVTPRNRLIAEPYPRFLVARDQANQGAAVLLCSLDVARRAGVPADRLVFLHGHADVAERDLLDRADLSASPAAVLAIGAALSDAGIGVDELAFLDLYSCFPIAVSNVADPLRLRADDPRGLTVTGGLPFFGGAGNDYAMHAIAELARRLRARPGAFGLATANGGILSKYSVGVYSTRPCPWRPGRSAELQADIDAWPAAPRARDPHGPATVETCTVTHGRGGARAGIVVARLDEGPEAGARFLAVAADEPATWALLDAEQPIGRRVRARRVGDRTVVRAHDDDEPGVS